MALKQKTQNHHIGYLGKIRTRTSQLSHIPVKLNNATLRGRFKSSERIKLFKIKNKINKNTMNKLTPNHYKFIIRDISEGKGEAFEVFVPALNAHNFGDTIEEALNSYYVYFESEVKRRKRLKMSMPKSDIIKEKTKQVPLRLSESIYEKTASRAKEKGLSFNGFVATMLDNISMS